MNKIKLKALNKNQTNSNFLKLFKLQTSRRGTRVINWDEIVAAPL